MQKSHKKRKKATEPRSINEDGSPKVFPDKPTPTELEYFLEKQTVKSTLKPLFNEMSHVQNSDVRIDPIGKTCPRYSVFHLLDE